MQKKVWFGLISVSILLILYASDTIGFIGLVLLGGLVMLILMIWVGYESAKKEEEETEKLQQKIKSLPNFKISRMTLNGSTAIATDNESRQIALKTRTGDLKVFPFEKILKCEIIEDGRTANKKSGVIGRAIVGGVLAGGAGAVVGGLSGREKQNKTIKKLDLKIVIKDSENPTYVINFIDAREELKKEYKVTDKKLKVKLNKILHWKDRLDVIIDECNSSKQENNTPSPTRHHSVSDELVKLNDLKEKGILTEAEFLNEKEKLLGN